MKGTRKGCELDQIMLEQMEKQSKLKTDLIELENNNNLHWKKYDAKMCVFPTLVEEDVRNMCCSLSSSILLMSTEINFSGNY